MPRAQSIHHAQVALTINDEEHHLEVDTRTTLLDLLRVRDLPIRLDRLVEASLGAGA
ncbi:MAG TPA: hypothetical protein VF257_14470 [Solirubrobacteraceae bacterium]